MAAGKLVREQPMQRTGPLVCRRGNWRMAVVQKFSYLLLSPFPLSLTLLLREEPPGASSDHGLTPRTHELQVVRSQLQSWKEGRMWKTGRSPLCGTAVEKWSAPCQPLPGLSRGCGACEAWALRPPPSGALTVPVQPRAGARLSSHFPLPSSPLRL